MVVWDTLLLTKDLSLCSNSMAKLTFVFFMLLLDSRYLWHLYTSLILPLIIKFRLPKPTDLSVLETFVLLKAMVHMICHLAEKAVQYGFLMHFLFDCCYRLCLHSTLVNVVKRVIKSLMIWETFNLKILFNELKYSALCWKIEKQNVC